MLMAALRLNIPAIFVSGGPMEAGKVVLGGKEQALDLVDAMVRLATTRSPTPMSRRSSARPARPAAPAPACSRPIP